MYYSNFIHHSIKLLTTKVSQAKLFLKTSTGFSPPIFSMKFKTYLLICKTCPIYTYFLYLFKDLCNLTFFMQLDFNKACNFLVLSSILFILHLPLPPFFHPYFGKRLQDYFKNLLWQLSQTRICLSTCKVPNWLDLSKPKNT